MPPKKKKKAATIPVKEVSVSLGITLNMGDYQSARMDVGLVAPIPEGADAAKVHKQATAEVARLLKRQAVDLETTVSELLS